MLARPLFLPLLAALGYAVAALLLKRATQEGPGPWRVSFVTNWLQAGVFSLLWFFPAAHAVSPENLWHASISGTCFFTGQVFTFLALSRGDVSVATPVLGAKVIFVALLTVLLGTGKVTLGMWIAVLLTAVATALIGGGARAKAGGFLRSLIYGFSAALSFALTDVLQQRWLKLWGFTHYMPAMFLVVALLSLFFLPLFAQSGQPFSPAAWRWTLAGGSTLALQACGVAWSIVTLGATTTNVLYNSRGLWTVLLVWTVGHWFANFERDQGAAIMRRRLAGSTLLLVAIAVIATQS